VLRPGGTFVGYDLADAILGKASHVTDHSPHQFLRPGDMLGALGAAGFERARVSSGFGRQLIRFIAVKPG
jgi:hypothetical protein